MQEKDCLEELVDQVDVVRDILQKLSKCKEFFSSNSGAKKMVKVK